MNEVTELMLTKIYSRVWYDCGEIPFVKACSWAPAVGHLGVWAVMLKVGIVGEGRLGIAPLTGWVDPVPTGTSVNKNTQIQ